MAQVESLLARRILASGLVEADALAHCCSELGDDADDARIAARLVKQGGNRPIARPS
jgi:hypothetical protein